jgi:hypothetical protein
MTYNLVAQHGTEIKVNRALAPFFQYPVIRGPSFRRTGAAFTAAGFMNSSLPAVPDVGVDVVVCIKDWIQISPYGMNVDEHPEPGLPL